MRSTLLAVLLLASLPAWGGVFHVNKAAAPGGDGTSWATAFQTIQPAIDAAFNHGGGEVWVAAGVYDEARDPETGALQLREGVSLYGGFEGGETQRDQRDFVANEVVVTGEVARGGAMAFTVMRMESHTLVDGLSIVGALERGISVSQGEDITISNVTFRGHPDQDMMGLWGAGSNFNIRQCAFLDLRKGGAFLAISDSTILDSRFLGNRSNDGGGLYAIRLGNVRIERCIFANNSATYQGGALFLDSAEWEYCYYEDRYPQISDCLFVGNSAGSGGAVRAYVFEPEHDKAAPTLDSKGGDDPNACNSWAGHGGYFATPIFSGCTFVDNIASYGGAVSGTEQVPGANCIFFNNSEPAVSPINVPQDMAFLGGFVYSNLQVCDGGEGNICGDPLFVNAANGDYRLRRDSPCLDAGKNTNTAFYGMAAFDFVSNPRGYDARAGSQGDGSNFDMGAFERMESRHDGDQNGDGQIGLSELLRVIQFYNVPRYGCQPGTEDGFAPEVADENCAPHSGDYNPQDWRISLGELLRIIQFYNLAGYTPCEEGEDGYCAG